MPTTDYDSSTYLMSLAFYALLLEITAVILLMLPFITPAAWSRVFATGVHMQHAKSGFWKYVRKIGRVPFFGGLLFMGIIFYDARRVVTESQEALAKTTPDAAHFNIEYMYAHLFRAQRDLYISGFALFLVFVIYRLITIITEVHHLEASCTAALRQAESANRAAEMLASELPSTKHSAGERDNDINWKIECEKKNRELERLRKDFEALKSQSNGLAREYDRLADDHSKKIPNGDKKDH